ncbi:MAG TPA: acetyl-CoA carboxylase biotin carboxyl carrier protein subunit [Bryobacteraceae bacterium]|nr:acetyl-CoA carboxylase biotin carboxyl carrier protein subunit [Bryobacteraceae bacterium]
MKLRITLEGKSYDVSVELLSEDAPAPQDLPAPAPRAIRPPPPPFAKGKNVPRSDEKTCRSPLAGLVTTVAVAPGDAVEKNQTLVVIEAMKMETKINSLGAGKVKSVLVAPGDGVKPGQVLIEIE